MNVRLSLTPSPPTHIWIISVRAKYEHHIREVEYSKSKAIGEFEEEIEILKTKNRHEERKGAELQEEIENKETDLSQAKKRNQRLLAELHDTKVTDILQTRL